MRELKIEEAKNVGGAELQVMGDYVLQSTYQLKSLEIPDEVDLFQMIYNQIFNPVDIAAEKEAKLIEEYKRQGKKILQVNFPL
jgi:hypothetical protein